MPSSWGMLRLFRALREMFRGEERDLRMLFRVLGFSLVEGLGVADLGSARSSGSGLKRSLRDCSSILVVCDRERLLVEGRSSFSIITLGTSDLEGFLSGVGSAFGCSSSGSSLSTSFGDSCLICTVVSSSFTVESSPPFPLNSRSNFSINWRSEIGQRSFMSGRLGGTFAEMTSLQ